MSYVAKGDKEYDATGAPLPPAKTHKIRITLTSGNVKNLEKCMYSTTCVIETISVLIPLQSRPISSTEQKTRTFA